MSAPETASLRPVAGQPDGVEQAVVAWLEADDPPQLTVQTSGSTSGPKQVLLSVAAIRASATATLRRLGGPGQWLLALPVHYVAGLQVITRSVLSGTSPVVLDDHPDLTAATAAVGARGRDGSARRYASLVPTQLHRFLASPEDAAALAAYDGILLGGSAAPAALLERAWDAGVHVVTTYGMSETCGGCIYDGLPLDGVAVTLGADAEIRISGPVLFDGYADQPEQTATVLRDGWFHTADRGRIDDDGRVVSLGRIDDVVISGGINVALSAVEERLLAMPGAIHPAVTSYADPEWGDEVVAVFERDAPAPTLEEVRDFVAAEHPRAWAPRRIAFVDQIPMLSSGKVDRRALARLVAEQLR